MGVFKEMVIENEDSIFRELERLQQSFFEIKESVGMPMWDFPGEEISFEPDFFTLKFPQCAEVSAP